MSTKTQTPDIDEYIASHCSAEPEALHTVWRRTHRMCVYPRMCSGHVQGRLLKMLTSMIAPRRVVELGAFTGYSAMCIAEGMAADGVLHTIEVDEEIEDLLRSNIALSPHASKITVHIGDALATLPTLGADFDMAFIDANKRHYKQYLDALLPLMRPGGYILADNTLWDGHVIDNETADPQTRGIMEFNDYVARHPRLETVIIPLRDGLTICKVV